MGIASYRAAIVSHSGVSKRLGPSSTRQKTTWTAQSNFFAPSDLVGF